MIITGRAPGGQLCWSAPWMRFSARTPTAADRSRTAPCWSAAARPMRQAHRPAGAPLAVLAPPAPRSPLSVSARCSASKPQDAEHTRRDTDPAAVMSPRHPDLPFTESPRPAHHTRTGEGQRCMFHRQAARARPARSYPNATTMSPRARSPAPPAGSTPVAPTAPRSPDCATGKRVRPACCVPRARTGRSAWPAGPRIADRCRRRFGREARSRETVVLNDRSLTVTAAVYLTCCW